MTAREAVDLVGKVRPRVALPVHYEGWSHFHQGRDAIEETLSVAPAEVRESFRFLEPSEPTTIPM